MSPPLFEVLDYETAGVASSEVVRSPQDIQVGDHIHWRHLGAWRDGIVLAVRGEEDEDVAAKSGKEREGGWKGDPRCPDSWVSLKGKGTGESGLLAANKDLVVNSSGKHQGASSSSSSSACLRVTLTRYSYKFPRMEIAEEHVRMDLLSDLVRRYDYGEFCHPPDVVLQRARACLGHTGYNAIRNNNEDFCRWCKAGKHTYMLRNDFQLAGLTDKDDSEVTDWMPLLSWEDAVPGDHVAWRTGLKPCQHGIVLDLDSAPVAGGATDCAQIVTSYKQRCDVINLCVDGKLDVYRVLYRRCHTSSFVVQRTLVLLGSPLAPEDSYTFAKWCKTGVPTNSKVCKVSCSENLGLGDLQRLGVEAVGLTSRAGTTTMARGVASALGAQTCSVGAKLVVESSAAAAAVGVEAVMMGVEVGLTYKSFKRRQISKDELNRRNIVAVARSGGAAGCTIAGGLAGSAVGSSVPLVGTVVGGILGAIIGGLGGQIVGHVSGTEIAKAASRPYEYKFVRFEVDPVI